MSERMLLTAGAALLAVAACSRGEDNPNTPPNVQFNQQTGVVTTKQGIQANGLSAAGNCLSPSDMQRPPSAFPPEQRREIVACMNAALAAQINPQLPRQIDELTRLDRIVAEGPTVTYHYTVLRSASSLPPNAAQQIETGGRRLVCSQPAMRQTLQMGGAYGYRYVDNQGALIHAFRVDAC
ncbi:MAG TPA: hypothetical protein VEC11_12625 [Allosphingosinicella sp.]|nr:hypothetical protein [Allosphingosinicella sp.]